MGIFLYEEEVQALIEKYDISKDGCLDYDEFAKAIGRVDLSRLSTHSYDEALIGRPAPVPPTMFDLKPSEEIKLRHLVEEIRAKVCSHWRSSRRAFLEVRFYLFIFFSSFPSALSLRLIAAGIRRA